MDERGHTEDQEVVNSQPARTDTTPNVLQLPTAPAPQSAAYTDLKVDGCTWSGLVQIVIGVLCIIFGSVSVSIGCSMTSVGYPFWGGALFSATGLVGCRVAKRASKGNYVALTLYATLVIFSGVTALNMLVHVCQAVTLEEAYTDGSHGVTSPKSARVAIDGVLVFLASAEITTSIWAGIAAFSAIHKRNKQLRVLTTQQVITTYGTSSYTATGQPPYPGMCYPPIDTGPPPKYDTIVSETGPPSYNDLRQSRES